MPSIDRKLSLHGIGLVTDQYDSLTAFAHSLPRKNSPATTITPDLLDPSTIAQHDTLTQLALRAAHQAYSASNLAAIPAERIGLLFISTWGTIDSTVAYLDSMLDADGRYASPRHFSRSVYSAVASTLAIHFKIQGPCETLSFPDAPIPSALRQAFRLLHAHRADRLLVLWADQSAPIAQDLARRAADQLARKEYARYAPPNPPGQGAVALVLGRHDVHAPLNFACESLPLPPSPLNPFPTDSALGLVSLLLTSPSS
jgi:hypothetical protein